MKLKRIEYEACFNLGNYENERIRLVAEVSPDEITGAVVEKLRELAIATAKPKQQDIWNKRNDLEYEVRNLERKVANAREQWRIATEFMVSQGLKTDVSPFPELVALLPAAEEEEVVEAEYDDENEEDENGEETGI